MSRAASHRRSCPCCGHARSSRRFETSRRCGSSWPGFRCAWFSTAGSDSTEPRRPPRGALLDDDRDETVFPEHELTPEAGVGPSRLTDAVLSFVLHPVGSAEQVADLVHRHALLEGADRLFG